MQGGQGNLDWLLGDSQVMNALAEDHGLTAVFSACSSIDSTQDYLSRLPAEALSHGQTVVTDYQSAGHGRMSRAWTAPAGSGLMLSTVVRAPAPQPLLPLMAGLAVVDALKSSLPELALKWPNDIVMPVKEAAPWKLGGIVVAVRADADDWCAQVGIGINLKLAAADRPTDIARSVADFTAESPDRNRLAVEVVAALQQRLLAPQHVIADYRAVCCSLGQWVRAEIKGEPDIEGIAVEIDEVGGLVVQCSGFTKTLRAADLIHLRRT